MKTENEIKTYAKKQDSSIVDLSFEEIDGQLKVSIERKATKACAYYDSIDSYIRLSIKQAKKEIEFFEGLLK